MAKKNRSPNAPAVSLKSALNYTSKLRKYANGMHPVPINDVLKDVWDMKPQSAYGRQVVAALISFGLASDEGKGEKRMVKVSELGAKIDADHSDRDALLKKAAVTPPIHDELWKRYGSEGLPPDATMRQYLVWDREGNKFNEATVDEFLGQFRETIDFADLKPTGTMDRNANTDAPEEAHSNLETAIEVGQYVQWTFGGVDQWKSPRQIVGFSDDGEWAFIEGEKAAVAVGELEAHPPKSESKHMAAAPPANPHFHTPTPHDGVPISVVMGKGAAEIINIPKMTAKAFDFFKSQLDAFEEAIVVEPENESDS